MRKLYRWILPLLLICCILCSAVSAETATGLVPGGSAVGIRLEIDGVIVTGFPEQTASPAKTAGIEVGDRVVEINQKQIRSAEDIQSLLDGFSGESVELTVERGGKQMRFSVTPQLQNGVRRLGLLVKDHVNGIGTLTYYDPESGRFGALGHAVNVQNDTSQRPQDGSLSRVEIVSIQRGEPGKPGSLQGVSSAETAGATIGRIDRNLPQGIFGALNVIPPDGEVFPIAEENELQHGDASILCTLDGQTPRTYAVEIVDVRLRDPNDRNLQLKVTDPVLLSLSGGIVQGISGAPILQNGKLIGAVTHVLIDHPERGYGIYIGRMLDADNG